MLRGRDGGQNRCLGDGIGRQLRTDFPLSTGARVAVVTSSLLDYQRVERRRPRCPKRTAAHEMAKTSGLGGSQPRRGFC